MYGLPPRSRPSAQYARLGRSPLADAAGQGEALYKLLALLAHPQACCPSSGSDVNRSNLDPAGTARLGRTARQETEPTGIPNPDPRDWRVGDDLAIAHVRTRRRPTHTDPSTSANSQTAMCPQFVLTLFGTR